ncbi:MAG: 50S ribosomal protein L17 [Desulfobacteraceae bacterium]|nr:MAG: 50S ribosomal protein L17 [Desulfobacteraceae bacterium]
MRHGKSGRKLNRSSSHRLAMFRNMVTSLLDHERIYTTHAKAKELRRWADWMITLGKRGDLHARRQALQVIRDKSVVHKLFTDLAQRYQARSGGYTRTVKVGFRVGDGAPLSLIELMTGETVKKKKRKRKPRKAVEAAPPAVEEAVVEEAVAEEAVAEEAVEKKKKKSKPAKKVEAEAPAAEEAVEKKKKKSKAEKKAEAEARAAAEAVEEKAAADEVSEPEPEKAAKTPKKKKAKIEKDKEGDEK